MKLKLVIVCLIAALHSTAQTDSSNWDRTLEGVHKKSSCSVDTTFYYHRDKKLVLNDTINYSYSFEEGKRDYFEVRIRTTVCWCTDCSYADHIIIDITDLKVGEILNLNSENSVWLVWNSLMIAHREESFAGSFNVTGSSDYIVEIYKYVPGQSWLTYDGIKVLTKPAK